MLHSSKILDHLVTVLRSGQLMLHSSKILDHLVTVWTANVTQF